MLPLASQRFAQQAPHSLFAHVQSYFTEYLPRQRGASVHTIRAYRDALALLFRFVAEQRGRGVASLQVSDLDANTVTHFFDHIETERSNSAATRNCRRTAIQSFFKHVLRDDPAHSLQCMRVLPRRPRSRCDSANAPRTNPRRRSRPSS